MLRLAPVLARPRRSPHRLARKVLVIRPDHVGDVLLSSPAMALLRASLPDASLTYLVGPWSAAVAQHGPAVDHVDVLAFPGFTRRSKANAVEPYALLAREALRLRRAEYDLAVVLRPDHWWGALLALAAGVPARVGGATPDTTRLLTHAYRTRPGEHAVDETLGIARLALAAVGVAPAAEDTRLTFRVSARAREQAAARWQAHALTGKQVVAVHPSAGAELKSWPVARWAALVDGLRDIEVLLTGGPGDGELLHAIATRSTRQPSAVCGQPLDVTAALFERCRLVIGADSGATHLASAVGTPTVRLFGPAPTWKYGPWPQRADQVALATNALACVPCGHLQDPPCGARTEPACMLALDVERVLSAANALLARTEN
jgi:ADP-heptose:LPS heptosyltransferase